jgi:hypothetical protein
VTGLQPARLRWPEWLVGSGGALLLVFLFGVNWFGLRSGSFGININGTGPLAGGRGTIPAHLIRYADGLTGWDSFSVLRWFLLATALLALSLALTQAAFRAPAVPVSLAVIAFVVSLITFVWLAVRLVFAGPGGGTDLLAHRPGAWLALGANGMVVIGALWSLRVEGIRPEDGPGEIPLVTAAPAGGRALGAARGPDAA